MNDWDTMLQKKSEKRKTKGKRYTAHNRMGLPVENGF